MLLEFERSDTEERGDPYLNIAPFIASRRYEWSLSGILCVGHNMRSVYAPETEIVCV